MKLSRAQEHLDNLKKEIGVYRDSEPFDVPLEEKNDGQVLTCKPVLRVVPPPRLSAIIGDCVGNLRSSLDHIIWQLASKHSSEPLIPKKDKPQFPISDKSPLDTRNLAKYGIPVVALNLIESVQPYHKGHEPTAVIRDLSNEDKHRLPVLTVACPEWISLTVDGKLQSRAFPAESHRLGTNRKDCELARNSSASPVGSQGKRSHYGLS